MKKRFDDSWLFDASITHLVKRKVKNAKTSEDLLAIWARAKEMGLKSNLIQFIEENLYHVRLMEFNGLNPDSVMALYEQAKEKLNQGEEWEDVLNWLLEQGLPFELLGIGGE